MKIELFCNSINCDYIIIVSEKQKSYMLKKWTCPNCGNNLIEKEKEDG